MFCTLDAFEINGIKADINDFGEQYDREPFNAQYCCGNMCFNGIAPSDEVLDRYEVSEDEYWEIVNELEDTLSFGRCNLCE
jgi:hypothetical protein